MTLAISHTKSSYEVGRVCSMINHSSTSESHHKYLTQQKEETIKNFILKDGCKDINGYPLL